MDEAKALAAVLPESRWEAVAIASGYLASLEGATDEEAAKVIYDSCARGHTLARSRVLLSESRHAGIIALLKPRERTGSAENPITKLFPATITEQRFIELLERLVSRRGSLGYSDDRWTGHKLMDFTVQEDGERLPINTKNAGARFREAKKLVGIDPDDCIPIPAYKAHAALEAALNLLYVVSVDYNLVTTLDDLLPKLMSEDEVIVWELLNRFTGKGVRDAEDRFIQSIVGQHWAAIKDVVKDNPFHVISARKAIRILQTKPKRTPGIGMRAWGTGASAEVNVHISISQDMTPWEDVEERIVQKGVGSVSAAIERTIVAKVHDPEL